MPDLRIGELFAGYGGLGMGVQRAIGGEIAWFSEFDKGPSKILEYRFPGVPNHGDITKIDWSTVEPVDVLTGGSPCQDLSHAGKRSGMTEGTRSNLWVAMREAIAQLRPSLVVWENVRGAGSAEATSDLEFCAGCMGDPWYRGTVLRALGRVVGDLSDLGYVGRIRGIRAVDVGAPHGRFRYFLAAEPADQRHEWGWTSRDGRTGLAHGSRGPLLGTPRASEWKGSGPVGSKSHAHMLERDYLSAQVLTLLPTPTAQDASASGGSSTSDVTLTDATVRTQMGTQPNARLLPTPRAGDGEKGGPDQAGSSGDLMLSSAVQPERWGVYADAIARWEALTRPAPAPTQPSKKGTPQLSAAFSEWLMGLPAGWVTDAPGITRNEALKALGNGVVPQQAEAALRFLLGVTASEAVA